MDKFGVILFGRTTAKSMFRWEYLQQNLHTLDYLDKEISLVIFQDEPSAPEFKEDVLNQVDKYKFVSDERKFQDEMVSQIQEFKDKGYQKVLMLSCCHAIDIRAETPKLNEMGIWDKRLVFLTDTLESKTLNHRFMYGDIQFVLPIWSRKKFLPQRNVDENLYLNAKNIIGEELIAKQSYTDDLFNVTRIGWGTE